MEQQHTPEDPDPKKIQEDDTALKELANQNPEQDSQFEPVHPDPRNFVRRFVSDLKVNMNDLRHEQPGVHAQLAFTGVVLFVGGAAVGAGAATAAAWMLRRYNVPSRAVRAQVAATSTAKMIGAKVQQMGGRLRRS